MVYILPYNAVHGDKSIFVIDKLLIILSNPPAYIEAKPINW